MSNVHINADFPEHRKKKLVETASNIVLVAFLRDFLAFSAAKQSPQDELIDDFMRVNDELIANERSTMNSLLVMADHVRQMLGQTVLPQDKPSVGPKQSKSVATVQEVVTNEEVDPVLQAMIAQEAVGMALEPIKEQVIEHKDRTEVTTKLGTRLAAP